MARTKMTARIGYGQDERGSWPKKWRYSFDKFNKFTAKRGTQLSWEDLKMWRKYYNKKITQFRIIMRDFEGNRAANIGKSHLKSVISRSKYLRHLQLSITSPKSSVESFLQLNRLTSLTLSNATNTLITHKGMRTFLTRNNSLSQLRLFSISTPFYKSLMSIRGFHSLKYLFIDQCAQASKTLFTQILSKTLVSLETLVIDQWNPDPAVLEIETYNYYIGFVPNLPIGKLILPYIEDEKNLFPFIGKLKNLKQFKTEYNTQANYALESLNIKYLDNHDIDYDLRTHLNHQSEISNEFLSQLNNIDYLSLTSQDLHTCKVCYSSK